MEKLEYLLAHEAEEEDPDRDMEQIFVRILSDRTADYMPVSYTHLPDVRLQLFFLTVPVLSYPQATLNTFCQKSPALRRRIFRCV